ncbi:MAG: TIGR02302 family protein, partial [Hyphomicrobiaceae bacterium]
MDLLEKRIGASRRALLLERIWPRIWPPLAVALVFLLVTFVGLWPALGATVHQALLAVFAIAFLASLVPLVRISRPGREEAVRHLEKKSGVPHRPASAYDDTLTPTGNASSDRQAQTLWQAHRNRLAAMFGRLRPGTPRPRIDRRDPLALRIALILATVVAGLFAWPTAGDRIMSAFRVGPSLATLEARLDAWVAPPHYTGKAPIMLADGSVAQKIDTDEARLFEVPSGSVLIVRASGIDKSAISVTFRPDGNTEPVDLVAKKSDTPDAARAPASIAEFRHKLTANGVISLAVKGSRLKGWQFQVTPDKVPTIELTKKPGKSARAALSLSYRITDDYGVTAAESTFQLTEKSRKRAGATAGPALQNGTGKKALWPAPKFPLRLPRRNAKKVEARTYQDLTAHPWAGLEVEMTLSARDQAGQVGTRSYVYKLPARKFRKPMARAVVEQRRNLAINPASRGKVATAIDAITIAPELFIPDRTVYLGLRSVYWRLTHDISDAALKTTVDQLWQIALRIEDGNLSQAER